MWYNEGISKENYVAGNKVGGKLAAATNKILYGEDFYKRAGKKGGEKSRGGGFAADHELARIAGKKGGEASRRGRSKRKYNRKLDEEKS